MSFTTLDHDVEAQSNLISASPDTLRRLSGVPAGFRLGGMMLLRAKRGSIRFDLPDGRKLLFDHGEKGPNAVVEVHDFDFARRAVAGGDIGFAESYMDQAWSTPDLTSVLEFFSENFEAAGQLAVGGFMVRLNNMVRHFFNRNSKAGSKRNIEAHYDLGNDFYELWLDKTMTYSSALYAGQALSLEDAQAAKYTRICDELDVTPGKSLLEIGCGWGGFAEYAAKVRGARVTCLTISPAQRDWALERMQREGLSERVHIRLEDYRDHIGTYDGVASIEMFEAVGERFWPSYFAKVSDSLKDGARAALQIITIQDSLFPRYRKRADFIQRYIFPGGMLPSELALREQVMAANLQIDNTHYFGADYAKTLRIWAKAFEEKWGQIAALGFDERFRRLWRFYLSYCEAGFDNGRINVGHFTLSKR
ncbi:MAG: cyclopropane-fatty-acyl-phospholipid synthase family protein [Pseudomonadota bacterium]